MRRKSEFVGQPFNGGYACFGKCCDGVAVWATANAVNAPLGIKAKRAPLPSTRPNRSFDLKLMAHPAKTPGLQLATFGDQVSNSNKDTGVNQAKSDQRSEQPRQKQPKPVPQTGQERPSQDQMQVARKKPKSL